METYRNVISRSDINLIPVTKSELIALLNQLDYLHESTTIGISCNFLREIIRIAIDGKLNNEERKENEELIKEAHDEWNNVLNYFKY